MTHVKINSFFSRGSFYEKYLKFKEKNSHPLNRYEIAAMAIKNVLEAMTNERLFSIHRAGYFFIPSKQTFNFFKYYTHKKKFQVSQSR